MGAVTPMLRDRAADPSLHDVELVVQVARGDLGALGVLYDRYAQSLLRFARRHSPAEDAEDVVQTAFLRAVTAATRFDPKRSVRPWLFGIMVQVLRERRRSLRRLLAAMTALAQLPTTVAAEPSEARRDLERCLGRLSEAKRTVVLLAEVHGLTCPEIAEVLGIPIGTVWTRLHHARRDLRRDLEETP